MKGFRSWTCGFDCFRVHSVCTEWQNLFARVRLLSDMNKKENSLQDVLRARVRFKSEISPSFKNQRSESRAPLKETANISHQ